ncbi:hypothetical protein D0S45_05535 [Marinifilum sp. JC120]|nr:hypothetical protein D0S45_05535 [Marinifilum sp. JC120]
MKEVVSMRKSRFSESQIIKILKETEGGRKVADVCRDYKVSQADSELIH